MKNIKMIIAALALVCSCAKVELPEQEVTVINAVADDSRTYLDGVKVLWNDDDVICVNGEASTSATVSEDGRSAQFTLPLISAPYYALYPASAFVEDSFAPGAQKYGSLVLPAEQAYVENSFDPATALMCGNTDVSADVNFSLGVAFIRLAIEAGDDPHDIRKVEVSANGGEDMSGVLEYNPAAGALVASGGSGKKVVLSAANGIQQGSAVYLSIAARNYPSGIKIRVVDIKGHYQDITSAKAFNAEAGRVYKTSVTFHPTGTLVGVDVGGAEDHGVKKILFIGNSHNLDATDQLPLMLNHEGVRNVELTRSFHGGYYLVGYDTYFSTANNAGMGTWVPGQRFWHGTALYTSSLEDIVTSDTFDIVVLQEYSGNVHCWTWDDAERNAIHSLIAKIRQTSPNAEFVYFQSHCWANGYETLLKYFANNVEMFQTCVDENSSHVMDPAEGYPFKRIISTGALMQSLRTTGLNEEVGNGRDMMRGDYVHLDYGLSRFAASLLMWKTFITPLTGIQPEDVTYRFTESYQYPTMYTTPVTEDVMPTILAAVNAAYEHPFEITDLSAYTATPSHVDNPGSVALDDTGVDEPPVTFPVEFQLSYWGGNNAQFQWAPLGVWMATQQQAYAKWVMVSSPVDGVYCKRTFFSSEANNKASVAVDAAWTGDYFEFVLPVKNFQAGTTVRFSAPVYTRQGPCFWALDYLDGDTWKSTATEMQSWDETFTRTASFALKYNVVEDVSIDCPFENAVPKGYLRFRLRCVDGSLQAANGATVQRDTPNMVDGAFSAWVYFSRTSANPSLSFSIVQ
ncbi:MAG: DUF4886 domain-containing protein [Bacteroidales bacterium]|nr:DUF4886 domain-containing protein [Bacteroidales bacterium]